MTLTPILIVVAYEKYHLKLNTNVGRRLLLRPKSLSQELPPTIFTIASSRKLFDNILKHNMHKTRQDKTLFDKKTNMNHIRFRNHRTQSHLDCIVHLPLGVATRAWLVQFKVVSHPRLLLLQFLDTSLETCHQGNVSRWHHLCRNNNDVCK